MPFIVFQRQTTIESRQTGVERHGVKVEVKSNGSCNKWGRQSDS